MTVTVLAINLIVSDPQVRRGRPVIAGTGICVSDVAASTVFQQQTPDEIAVGFGLSLSQVYAALAYYYDHKAEIDDEIRQRDARIVEMKEKGIGRGRPVLPG
jgi:uncharacterized protein (DUF433 family)